MSIVRSSYKLYQTYITNINLQRFWRIFCIPGRSFPPAVGCWRPGAESGDRHDCSSSTVPMRILPVLTSRKNRWPPPNGSKSRPDLTMLRFSRKIYTIYPLPMNPSIMYLSVLCWSIWQFKRSNSFACIRIPNINFTVVTS